MNALLPLQRTLTDCDGLPRIAPMRYMPDVVPSVTMEESRLIENETIALEDADDRCLFLPYITGCLTLC